MLLSALTLCCNITHSHSFVKQNRVYIMSFLWCLFEQASQQCKDVNASPKDLRDGTCDHTNRYAYNTAVDIGPGHVLDVLVLGILIEGEIEDVGYGWDQSEREPPYSYPDEDDAYRNVQR